MKDDLPYKFYISQDGGKTLIQVSGCSTFANMCANVYWYYAGHYYIKTPYMKKPILFTKEEADVLFDGNKVGDVLHNDEKQIHIERKYKIAQL